MLLIHSIHLNYFYCLISFNKSADFCLDKGLCLVIYLLIEFAVLVPIVGEKGVLGGVNSPK